MGTDGPADWSIVTRTWRTGDMPATVGPFVATGVIVFSMFLMVGLVANQFGFDRATHRPRTPTGADPGDELVIARGPPHGPVVGRARGSYPRRIEL